MIKNKLESLKSGKFAAFKVGALNPENGFGSPDVLPPIVAMTRDRGPKETKGGPGGWGSWSWTAGETTCGHTDWSGDVYYDGTKIKQGIL